MAFGKKAPAPAPASAPAGKPNFGGKPPGAAQRTFASSGKAISLKPSDQQSGGILDDVDVLIKLALFTTWDYNGQQEPQLALRILYVEQDGKETVQYYSAGKLEHMVPAHGGRTVEAAVGSNKTGLNDNCNAVIFIKSLCDKGFP